MTPQRRERSRSGTRKVGVSCITLLPAWPEARDALGSEHFKQDLDARGHTVKSISRMVEDLRIRAKGKREC